MSFGFITRWWSERKWSKAKREASRWKKDALSANKQLAKSMRKMDSLRQKIDQVYDEARHNISHAQEVIDRYDHTEEMLSNELEVYRDIVVPQLTLATEVSRQQLEAEIALHTQRQAYLGAEPRTKE